MRIPSPGSPRARLSVVHYLICLALVPTIGLAALAIALVTAQVRDMQDAEQSEHAMLRVQKLADLHGALVVETLSAVLVPNLDLLGVSLDDVNGATAAVQPLTTVTEAQANTDRSLDQLGGDTTMDAEVSRIRSDVAAIRIETAQAQQRPLAQKLSQLPTVIDTWAQVVGHVSALQSTSVHGLATGQIADAGAGVLSAADQLRELSELTNVVHGEVFSLYVLLGTSTKETRKPILDRLADLAQSYDLLEIVADRDLTGPLGQAWDEYSASDAAKSLTPTITSIVADPPPYRIDRLSLLMVYPRYLQASKALDAMNALLTTAVHEGVEASRAEHDDAARSALITAAGAAFVLALTVVLLIMVGGTLRRHLQLLADSARQLSSGRLRTIPVTGPRELATAARGFNDAAETLARVVRVAEHLAGGDLDAAEQHEAVGGQLGEAVHRSVRRVAQTFRERESLRQELAWQARHDALTGLPNRAAAQALLGQARDDACVTGALVTLLFVDLDHFKTINDSYGHAAGDHVLITAASRMSGVVRPQDTVCRWGGDEFVVVINDIGSEDEAVHIGHRLIAALREPMPYGAEELQIGASIGFASDRGGRCTPEELLLAADHAVYRAKSEGRDTLSR